MKAYLDPGLLGISVEMPLQRWQESEIVEHARAQLKRYLARLLHDAAYILLDFIQVRLAGLFRLALRAFEHEL